MPHTTAQIAVNGPLVDVLVGVSGARQAALIAANQPVPPPVPARLLIDTGASATCLDPSILAPLALTPTGAIPAHTPSTQQGQPATFNQYDVSIIIPMRTLTRTFNALPAMECHLKHQGIDGLLGRDILSECLLIYTGPDNAFILSI